MTENLTQEEVEINGTTTDTDIFDEPAPERPDQEEVLELMGFQLGDEEYGIDIMKIKEITPLFELTPIPRAPSYILGILSLRGNIIPIFDAKKRMGLPESEITNRSRIIVLGNGDEHLGILVDFITSAAQIKSHTIEPPPPVIKGVDAEFIKGLGRYRDRMIIIMNTDEVLKVEDVSGS